MIKSVQIKIQNSPKYLEYLRTHSYWYKRLNRDSRYLKDFEAEVKEAYKLYPHDRLAKALNMLETIQTIISTING